MDHDFAECSDELGTKSGIELNAMFRANLNAKLSVELGADFNVDTDLALGDEFAGFGAKSGAKLSAVVIAVFDYRVGCRSRCQV